MNITQLKIIGIRSSKGICVRDYARVVDIVEGHLVALNAIDKIAERIFESFGYVL